MSVVSFNVLSLEKVRFIFFHAFKKPCLLFGPQCVAQRTGQKLRPYDENTQEAADGLCLLRKGPALWFFGGKEAIEQVVNESSESNNFIIIIICLSTPILAAVCLGVKKFKLRKEVSMVQRLNFIVYGGVSNIYGIVITMVTLLVIFISLVLHLIWSKINEGGSDNIDEEDGGASREMIVSLFLFFTFIHSIPFRSRALRFWFILYPLFTNLI